MIKYKSISISLVLFFLCAAPAGADTVYLKSGGSVSGIIEKEDDKSVEVNTGFGTVTFKKALVKNIERSSAEESREMVEKWEEKRKELKSKEKEFEEARGRRFELARENWMEDLKAKKSVEGRASKEIDIARGPDGRSLMAEVLLNNRVKVYLTLDTGASIVALSRKTGEDLGIDFSDTKKDLMEMRLADGRSSMARAIVLDSVKIQDVEVRNVAAAIMLDQTPVVGVTEGLLGMSFLGKFNIKTNLKNMSISLEKIE